MKKIFIVITVLFFTGVAYTLSRHTKAKTPLNVVAVTRGTIEEQAVAVGDIEPKHLITVKSQLGGIVETLFHDAGDYVKAHEKLLQVKPDPTPQEYAQAFASVAEDKANVAGMTKKVQNYEYLLKNKIISENYADYISEKQNLAYYKAQLVNDEQNLALLTQGKATISGQTVENIVTSPIEGFILARNVDVGDPVTSMASNQTATILFIIANMKDLIFKGSVDEVDANKLKIGMPATISIGALPEQKITGKLTKLSLQSDEQSQSIIDPYSTANAQSPFNVGFEVEIADLNIPNGLTLRSGFSATANIIVHSVKNVLLLPERAVIFKDGKTFVKLPAKKGGKPGLHPVTTGVSDGLYIEITQGLTENQKVLDNSGANIS